MRVGEPFCGELVSKRPTTDRMIIDMARENISIALNEIADGAVIFFHFVLNFSERVTTISVNLTICCSELKTLL